jgi:AcrR family transcriptional regulator
MIIGVAARLFATTGLRRTTMETIAMAAGRGRRTVYMYFTNKAEIYDAVVELEIKMITEPLRDLVATSKDFDTLLHRYGEQRIIRMNSLLTRNPLLLKDFSQGHSRIERLRERLNNDELQILTPLFRKQIGSINYSGQPSPEDFAVIFLNLLRGSDRLLTKTDGLVEANRFSAISANLVLKAIVGYRPDVTLP